jgi:Ser/Thr protein kinase RdoA (MazF antagonist)
LQASADQIAASPCKSRRSAFEVSNTQTDDIMPSDQPPLHDTPSQDTLPLDVLLTHLAVLAQDALLLWDLPHGATLRLINVSENVTYLVEAEGGFKSILRVHRENYHSERAIECELAWIDALRSERIVPVAKVIAGKNGQDLQTAQTPSLKSPRTLVMFEFLDGQTPDESGDLSEGFGKLGMLAARCHAHVLTWEKPAGFERLTWDASAVFGADPTWGKWQDAPGIDAGISPVLRQAETRIIERLADYGTAAGRFNLIHADMRLANVLMAPAGPQLIDFDDCGMGWFMYDFAAAISFIEDHPQVPRLKEAWLKGYRRVRTLDPADEAMIETMVMLRRMALLAWIGSHIEAPEPQALAPDFAVRTAELAKRYLAGEVL